MQNTTKQIISIPPEVELNDLQSNLKLFNEQEIASIKKYLTANGRYREVVFDSVPQKLRYAVIVQDGSCYAIYSGKKKLGNGAFARVKVVQDLETGKWTGALKVQELPVQNQILLTQHRHELVMLEKADKLIKPGLFKNGISFERFSQKKHCNQQYMLMKYARGKDLFDTCINPSYQPTVVWFNVILNTLKAVKKLHNNGIIHRDLKLENIRFDAGSDELEIVDFGLSVEKDKKGNFVDTFLVGTSGYIAPELINAKVFCYNESTYVYSLGVAFSLFLDLACQVSNPDKSNIFEPIEYRMGQNAEFYIPDKIIRNQVLDILKNMTNKNPLHRPDISTCIAFFEDFRDRLKINDKTIEVGVLDVRDYTLEIDKEKLFEKLRRYHQIYLYESGNPESDIYYAHVKKELELAGLIVNDKIYFSLPTDYQDYNKKYIYHFNNLNLLKNNLDSSLRFFPEQNLSAPGVVPSVTIKNQIMSIFNV